MNERLFRLVEQRQGFESQDESAFEFLERGGRPEVVEIRRWMERGFRAFPIDHRKQLKRRLQLKDFGEFMGAYFELQIFAMLRYLNCHVDVHPFFSETDGTVDFGVSDGLDRFYLEATVCGINQGILRSNANEEDAVRKIREALSGSHSDLWLSATGDLCTTLGRKRVIEPFRVLLKKYTSDDVRSLYLEEGPTWGRAIAHDRLSTEIKEGDWVLHGYLAPPIASDGRSQVHGPSRGGGVNGSTPLADALRRKAEDWRKKKLEQEVFLIAVNVCHSEYSWGDEKVALFECPDSISELEALSASLSQVSGIIVFDNAVLGAERGARVKLYPNGDKRIPDRLQFLRQETSLDKLLGVD